MDNDPTRSKFIVAGVSLTLPSHLVRVIGRADGDIATGDVLVDELDGRELGTVAKLFAYRRELEVISSGLTCEIHLVAAVGAEPFRVPSTPWVRRRRA
ncbi:MAG: hypothetical protein ACOZNI_25580 [Myxococcota bacterium]